jgi:hypothetical protein
LQNARRTPAKDDYGNSRREVSRSRIVRPDRGLMQIAIGFQLSACLYVAAKLNIADLVAHSAPSIDDLAASTGTKANALYHVLRAVISVGICAEPKPRVIALSPGSRTSATRRSRQRARTAAVGIRPVPHARRLRPAALNRDRQSRRRTSLRQAGVRAHRLPASNLGITAISRDFAPAVLDAYDFSGIGTLMNVAGGQSNKGVTPQNRVFAHF